MFALSSTTTTFFYTCSVDQVAPCLASMKSPTRSGRETSPVFRIVSSSQILRWPGSAHVVPSARLSVFLGGRPHPRRKCDTSSPPWWCLDSALVSSCFLRRGRPLRGTDGRAQDTILVLPCQHDIWNEERIPQTDSVTLLEQVDGPTTHHRISWQSHGLSWHHHGYRTIGVHGRAMGFHGTTMDYRDIATKAFMA